MGGRSAEEIFLGHITTGAGNDIERATDIARKMVCDWGMSTWGRWPSARRKKPYSWAGNRPAPRFREDTAIHIDKEVKRIVSEAYDKAHSLLSNNRDPFERIAMALLEREVLDANELKLLMEGKPLPEKVRTPPTTPPQAAPGTDPKGGAANAAGAGLHARRFSGEGVKQGMLWSKSQELSYLGGTQHRAPTFWGEWE